MRKQPTFRNSITHDELLKLLRKHKKIKVCVRYKHDAEIARERILTADGKSSYRWMQETYTGNNFETTRKFSRYFKSCFYRDYQEGYYNIGETFGKNRDKAFRIVKLMKLHDRNLLYIDSVFVGSKFKTRIV